MRVSNLHFSCWFQTTLVGCASLVCSSMFGQLSTLHVYMSWIYTATNFCFSCISFEEYQIVCILCANYQVYIWLLNVYSLYCITQSGFLYTALPFSRAFRLFWMPYLWIFEYLMWRPFGIWKNDILKQILDQLDCFVRVSVYFVFRLPKKNVKIRWLNLVQ